MGAANCTVRGLEVERVSWRGIGAFRRSLTGSYAGFFTLTAMAGDHPEP